MALKVEIYQKDNVKPFSPTPESSRNYKLSLFDQLISHFYVPIVFFYNSGADSHFHNHDELKESLSKTLSVYYPLAGRIKDGSTIECNDEGADFVRSNVTNYDLGDILRHPKLDLIRQLFPRDPYPTSFDPAQPMLAVQANRFRCGGTAVGICLWHGLLDGAGLDGFLQTWAAINRGERTTHFPAVIVNATSIFPPIKFDVSKSIAHFAAQREINRGKYSAKRFVFRAEEIERLKDRYSYQSAEHRRRPTRGETVSAIIWAAVIRATLKTSPNLQTYLLASTVDLRRRINPPFPPTCLGNMYQVTTAEWEMDPDMAVTPESLIGRIRESFVKVNDDYLRKMHVGGAYLKEIGTAIAKVRSNSNDNKILNISSWVKFPYLKVDFGWGKPIWVGSGIHLEDMAILLNTIDGGVEVWIGLPQNVMYNLEKDHELLAHVSFSQNVSEMPHIPSHL